MSPVQTQNKVLSHLALFCSHFWFRLDLSSKSYEGGKITSGQNGKCLWDDIQQPNGNQLLKLGPQLFKSICQDWAFSCLQNPKSQCMWIINLLLSFGYRGNFSPLKETPSLTTPFGNEAWNKTQLKGQSRTPMTFQTTDRKGTCEGLSRVGQTFSSSVHKVSLHFVKTFCGPESLFSWPILSVGKFCNETPPQVYMNTQSEGRGVSSRVKRRRETPNDYDPLDLFVSTLLRHLKGIYSH